MNDLQSVKGGKQLHKMYIERRLVSILGNLESV